MDFNQTFSPVVKWETIRILLWHAINKDLSIKQIDISNAYLYGAIDKTIYLEQPPGFVEDPNKVCQLNKALYGLRQSGRIWHKLLTDIIVQCGYRQSKADQCMFLAEQNKYVLIYVDDLLLIGDNTHLKETLQTKFTIHDLGKLHFFLSVRFEHTQDTIFVSQTTYISTIIEKFGMSESKPVHTPITKGSRGITPLPPNYPIRELIGCLNYLAHTSRPDLLFAVSNLSRYMANPTTQDWINAKRILRYLKGTAEYGYSISKSKAVLSALCDSDYGGDEITSRSTSSVLIKAGTTPIYWRSKYQKVVAQSTTEAELYAVSTTSKELSAIIELCLELQIPISMPVIV